MSWGRQCEEAGMILEITFYLNRRVTKRRSRCSSRTRYFPFGGFIVDCRLWSWRKITLEKCSSVPSHSCISETYGYPWIPTACVTHNGNKTSSSRTKRSISSGGITAVCWWRSGCKVSCMTSAELGQTWTLVTHMTGWYSLIHGTSGQYLVKVGNIFHF